MIFIAGNMPLKSEITPLLIMTKLEQYDYAGATSWVWSCWWSRLRWPWRSICFNGGAVLAT